MLTQPRVTFTHFYYDNRMLTQPCVTFTHFYYDNRMLTQLCVTFSHFYYDNGNVNPAMCNIYTFVIMISECYPGYVVVIR